MMPIRIHAMLAFAIVLLASAANVSAQGRPPPPAVVVAKVSAQAISDPDRFSGIVEAIQEVDIIARVQGFIDEIAFEAGDQVSGGDVLFRIESALYAAAVAGAEARLAQAEAQLLNANQELSRQQSLREREVAAQSTLEAAVAAQAVARAGVEIAVASLEKARIELSYVEIVAPFAGEIGRELFSRGALVGPTSGPLARLVNTDPVRVVFSISDRVLLDIRREIANGNVPDVVFRLDLANGEIYSEPARIEFIANEADPVTATVPVRLIVKNSDRLLIPGQFVDVVVGPADPPVLPVVPQTAVLQDRDGRYVYVLGENDTVAQRRIEVDSLVQGGWAVTGGLEAGEVVVVQGLQRLFDGVTVTPGAAARKGD
ncbi:MAG: efflux RND transporter periplasmic adaptor subunit [Proteobacteria bacterium]|nr:MAG: efflux RND transporter periplasmic adaptor subunit [Pseudomonadota bacterium]QKK12169.1 MAG: efflux RND transporter periplasmic adaptor subunit [Pseudomonadota bacterium]